jgi:hypothetical protein
MRYETPVKTGLHFGEGDGIQLTEVEVCSIQFGDRVFEWHSNLVAVDGDGRDFPTITTMARDGDDQESVDADTQRLLSALCFQHHTGLTADAPGDTGAAGRFDRAVLRAPGGTTGGLIARAPAEVHVVDDPVLRHALALYREGVTAASPFYGFLALWNALDVLFDGDEGARDAYLGTVQAGSGVVAGWDSFPADLAAYLRESSRNAVAHAVRVGRPVVDPDLPADRHRLQRDARLLEGLVYARVHDRWSHPVWSSQ